MRSRRDIDEVERCGGDEVLKAGLRADIVLQMGQQSVDLRLIEPDAVGHRDVNVHHHDMTPIRGSPVAARTIDAEGRP